MELLENKNPGSKTGDLSRPLKSNGSTAADLSTKVHKKFQMPTRNIYNLLCMKELAVSEKWYSRNPDHNVLDLSQQVKSYRGTQFRIRANQVLKNYLLQGYAVNEAHKAPSGLVFKNNISA